MELSGEKSCSNRNDQIQKVEPGNLLEECWFFGNLLNSASAKTKMSRCNSDPCPSSKFNCQEEMLVRNDGKSSCSSTKKQPKGDNIVGPKLARAPSLPSSMARAVEVNQEKESLDFSEGIKPILGSSLRNSLTRAPSLPPPCVGRQEEDEEDQESEFTLGRLIRQASLNSSGILPPRQTSKSCSSILPRKCRPRKKDMEGYKEMGQQYQIGLKKMAKSPSNLQPKEIQDFKALSLKSQKESLKLDGSNKVSGLQDMGKEKLRRSNSLSEASLYLKKSSASTIPNWAAAADNEKKSAQDLKAQIKFWARAVASNARAPGVLIANHLI